MVARAPRRRSRQPIESDSDRRRTGEASVCDGLISYGIELRQNYRRAAYFVDRILKGEKPGDLPVEFPTKVELVVNVTTAKAIGIDVPPSVLARADEVIE